MLLLAGAMSKLASRLEEWRAKQAEIAKGNIGAPKAGSCVVLGPPDTCSKCNSSAVRRAHLQKFKTAKRGVKAQGTPPGPKAGAEASSRAPAAAAAAATAGTRTAAAPVAQQLKVCGLVSTPHQLFACLLRLTNKAMTLAASLGCSAGQAPASDARAARGPVWLSSHAWHPFGSSPGSQRACGHHLRGPIRLQGRAHVCSPCSLHSEQGKHKAGLCRLAM